MVVIAGRVLFVVETGSEAVEVLQVRTLAEGCSNLALPLLRVAERCRLCSFAGGGCRGILVVYIRTRSKR